MDQFVASFSSLVASVVTVLTLVLPVIGVTGGLKGLIEGLPDLSFGKFTIKRGHWLSALVAAAAIGIGYATGLAPEIVADSIGTWLVSQWSLLTILANIVYNAAGYAGSLDWALEWEPSSEPEPEPEPVAKVTRTKKTDTV